MKKHYLIDLTLRGSEEDIQYVLREICKIAEHKEVKFMYLRELKD